MVTFSARHVVNADGAALQSAKSEEDGDLNDILELMDRVKAKRERLKKIGLKHRTLPPATSPARRPWASSSSPPPATTSSEASPAPPPARPPPSETNTPRKNNCLVDGEFVDEDLEYDDPAERTMGEKEEHKRVWTTRILSVAILSATLIAVLVFVLGIRRADEKASMNTTAFSNLATTPLQWSRECFQTTEELQAAVLAYLKDPTPNSEIAQEYGYPIGGWCVSNITDFNHIFSHYGRDESRHLYQEFNEPLDGWDTSSAVSFEGMFDGSRAFNQDISMWNVSQVTDFRKCFRTSEAFDQDLSTWDVRSAQLVGRMFEFAKSFRGMGGLGHWKTSNIEDMDHMFHGASAFIGEGVGSWNVSNVKAMINIFRDVTAFNQDLHLWRFSPEMEGFRGMFQGCSSFNGRIDGWNIEETNINSLERVFQRASSFNQPVDWNVSKIERFDQAFSGASNFSQDLNWDTALGYKFDEMFMDAASFNSDSITDWDMRRAEDVSGMFRGAASFNQPLDWNFTVVKDMSFMFADASTFNQDLYWNTDTVEDMSGMFSNAYAFNGDIKQVSILTFWSSQD